MQNGQQAATRKREYVAPGWDVIYEILDEIGPLFAEVDFDKPADAASTPRHRMS